MFLIVWLGLIVTPVSLMILLQVRVLNHLLGSDSCQLSQINSVSSRSTIGIKYSKLLKQTDVSKPRGIGHYFIRLLYFQYPLSSVFLISSADVQYVSILKRLRLHLSDDAGKKNNLLVK